MKRRGFSQSSGLFVGGISTGFSFIGPDKNQAEEEEEKEDEVNK